MQTSRCPDCYSDIVVEDEVYEGDLVNCANCGAELEIISLHPVQVRELKEEED
jgi:alpha-aminoadipate carrier protein LysW